MRIRAALAALIRISALVGLALALPSCGGSGGVTATAPPATGQTQASAPTTTQQPTSTSPPSHRQRQHGQRQTATVPKHHKPKPPPVPPGVARTLHAYIAALNDHDGAALCALFVPGALDELKLPRGSGCSGLSASIGYAGPHGLPVWTDAALQRIESVVTEGGGLRATVRIVDRYRNNPQPSYEDDVIFLAGSGGDWLIEKPSITIYRAIGTPNPPPTVLAAP
jgi:hypothetical protein